MRHLTNIAYDSLFERFLFTILVSISDKVRNTFMASSACCISPCVSVSCFLSCDNIFEETGKLEARVVGLLD